MTSIHSHEEPTIPGPYISPQQTETSPLKQSFFTSTKKSLVKFLWGWDFSMEGAGSLKATIVMIFGTTAIVTLSLLTQLHYGEYQLKPHGAISTDSTICSQIGIKALELGGHAVDAAVAATMCLGVVHFHITGLGGGGYLFGFNQKQQDAFDVINFLPSMPQSAESNIPLEPGQTVGVPGFLAGLWAAHQRHGRLPWKDLIMPSVDLARFGFPVTESLIAASQCLRRDEFSADLATLLEPIAAGQNLSLPKLAATLELISSKGISVFYNGTLVDELVYSVKVGRGGVKADDLAHYSPIFGISMKTSFSNYDIFVPASSVGGTLLLDALKNIQQSELAPDGEQTAESIRKLVDSLFEAYTPTADNKDKLLISTQTGASVVAVMDDSDNYVSVVTSLGTWLGSQLLTQSGFILNNALSNGNIDSENRPLSVATPVVAVERGNICGRRIVSGAADARTMAQVLTELLYFELDANVSIEAPRFGVLDQPRFISLEDSHEPKLSEITLNALTKMGVRIGSANSCSKSGLPYESINLVLKEEDSTWPYADSRGEGEAIHIRCHKMAKYFILILLIHITLQIEFASSDQSVDQYGGDKYYKKEKYKKYSGEEKQKYYKDDYKKNKYNEGDSFRDHKKHNHGEERKKRHDDGSSYNVEENLISDININTKMINQPKEPQSEIISRKTAFYRNMKTINLSTPPSPNNTVLMARYIVHNVDWASIATLTSRLGSKSSPFANIVSMSDGPVDRGSGVPFFYLTPMDLSSQDLAKESKASVSVTLAQTDFCRSGNLDPEDPRCARVILSGKVKRVKPASVEEEFARKALFTRHPVMESWPKDHDFYFARLKIAQIVLLDQFGGPKNVDIEEYLNAENPSS